LNKQIEAYPQPGWIKADAKKNRIEEELILRGDIIEEFHIGREIYTITEKYKEFDEILLFFSVGNLKSELETTIYRISNIDIKEIGTIEGQQFMYLDYNITVPIGSQGIFYSYVYVKGNIYRITDIN
jgi:gamma-glutamylcyclotransferase (GGCT)/AIG2-like uncharacterized protein YtfP